MADRKMADRKMADRKMADRKMKNETYLLHFSVSHFPVRSSSFFCLTFFCPLFFIFLSHIFLSALLHFSVSHFSVRSSSFFCLTFFCPVILGGRKGGRSPLGLNDVSLQSAWRFHLACQSINRIGLPFLQVGIEKIPVHKSVVALRLEQVKDQRRGRLRGSNQNRAGGELNCLML